jgi:hypothetical protein
MMPSIYQNGPFLELEQQSKDIFDYNPNNFENKLLNGFLR